MLVILIAFTAVLWILYSWVVNGKPKNFPPGLPVLPLVGSVPFMKGSEANFHFLMDKWRSKYGPVVGFFLGPRPALAIVEANAVIEALKHEDFQARPGVQAILDRTFGEKLGVFFSDGPYWVEQRRFTLRHLKEFGFGKKSMEGMILDEAEDLIKVMKRDSINPIQVSMYFAVPVINVLWSTMSGTRYDREDEEFQQTLDVLNRRMRAGNASSSSWYNMVPFLRGLSPEWREAQSNLDDLFGFVRKAVREHERTLDSNSSRDFIDVYLKEMHKGVPGSTFNEKSLLSICVDLFSAGAESVSNTLGFCLLYLLRNPGVQKAVHEELDRVVGRSRRPSLEDRPNLVYLEATLLEVMRSNPIAPLSVPHRASKATTFRGYDVPKDTMVLISLWSCIQDKTHWGDPENFRPERFIDADGKLVKDDFLVIFGVGKRVCLGEALARNTLFLFFATMMQEMTFSLPPGHELPSTFPLSGFTTAPSPFQVIATERV